MGLSLFFLAFVFVEDRDSSLFVAYGEDLFSFLECRKACMALRTLCFWREKEEHDLRVAGVEG